ncbi:MAG: extracellular solute-binding protein [Eubacterium sp.]|nr:extracellular solute-binding protein [Eubacterium sp.]
MKNGKIKVINGRIMRRVLCIVLAGVMMLEVSACGKNGAKKGAFDSKVAEAKAVSEETIFEETDFNFTETEGVLMYAVGAGDQIYYTVQDTDVDKITSTLYSVDINTGEVKDLDQISPDHNMIYTEIIKAQDGSIYVIKNDNDAKNSILYKFENDSLNEIIDLKEMGFKFGDPNSYYLDLIDKNGNYVMASNDEIKIYDKDFKEIFSQKLMERFILGYVNAKNGEIVFYLKSYDEDDNGVHELMVIDTDSYQVKKEIRLEGALSYDWPLMDAVGDYDFLCKNTTSIMGYVLDDERSEKIVDLNASNINSDVSPEIYMLDEKTFIADKINYGYGIEDDGSFTFLKFTKQDGTDSADKIVLTFAVRYGDYNIKQDIIDFNKSQSKYMIKLVDYSETDDPEAKLSADIASGNFPDIYEVDVSLGESSLGQAIEKGLFEDLVPYIEKDEDVNLDDLIPSVKNAILMDEKCYFLPSSFSLYTLVGRKSEVKDVPGWSYQEMKDYCYSKEDAQLFYSNTKKDTLFELLVGCGDEFIDWESGECHFDNDDFKNILEMANLGNDKDTNEDMMIDEEESIRDGKRLFREGVLALDDIGYMNVAFNHDFAIKGYPSSRDKGTHIVFPGMVAISSESKNKDAAWEFVKHFITEEYQKKRYQDFMGDPTRKDVYEVKCEALRKMSETTDKNVNDVVDENIRIYNDAIENASGMLSFDYTVLEIIEEEAAAYFAGDKSEDEVVKVIENRVNTYINENK